MTWTFTARAVPTFVLAGFLLASAGPARAQATSGDEPARRVVNDRCPVMTDEFASPLHEVEFHGSLVRFCCHECVDRFEADPVPFLKNVPHLPPEVVRLAKGETRGNGWMRPVLLTVAVLLACWVAVRLLLRQRRVAVHRPSGGPYPTA